MRPIDGSVWPSRVASLERRRPMRSVKRLSSKSLTSGPLSIFLRSEPTLRSASTGYWKGAGFMPLTRGEAVGYDADLMVFKFTMRNGEQIVACEISNAALGDLAGRWRRGERDVPAEFEAHRRSIETIASARFDQT